MTEDNAGGERPEEPPPPAAEPSAPPEGPGAHAPGEPRGDAPSPPDEDDDERLEDADPDETEKEREDSDRVALDTRVEGFARMLGRAAGRHGAIPMPERAGSGPAFGLSMDGQRAQAYQAEYMMVVQGDRSSRLRAAPMSATSMRRLHRTFARSSSYDALLAGFTAEPVQTLFGASGGGRTTTALAAVSAWAASAGLGGRVHYTEGPLASFDDDTLPQDGGLVFRLDPGEPAPGLAWLGAMAQTLRGREQPVVMVVVADTGPGGTAIAGGLVRHVPPPLEDVLERHLSAGVRPDQVSALLAHLSVKTELTRCRSPKEARELAADLLEGHAAGRDVAAVVANRDLPALEQRIREEMADKDAWTFLVTCAVLDGLTVGTVARESVTFSRLHTGAADRDGPLARFDKPIGEWSDSVVVRDTGAGAGSVVHLVHPRLVPRVLEMAWQDHVGRRDALLEWLRRLAVHPSVQVRVKAAQAMAKLATFDFEVIRKEVLREWAKDGGFRTRQAVAWSLEALAFVDDGRFAGRVQSMVRDWVRSQRMSLQAAGVATYGTYLGAQYPGAALQVMRRIAGGPLPAGTAQRRGRQEDHELTNIVEKAILDMFSAGAHEEVVRELATWTRLTLPRWRRCAAECLVRLSRQRGALPFRPLLMEIAGEKNGFRGDVAQLWRNALLPEHQRAGAWGALRRLVLQAESAAADGDGPPYDQAAVLAYQASVRRLLSDVAAGDSPADLARLRSMRFHVGFWEFRRGRGLSVVPDSLR